MKSRGQESAFDFALLQDLPRHHSSRNRRVLLLFILLLTLLALSAVGLIYYLQRFEAEEETRTQSADALWLEENVRFHLRRLEVDLESLAHTAIEQNGNRMSDRIAAPGGSLRSYQGVLLGHGWRAAGSAIPSALQGLWSRAHQQPLNAQALDSMLDVANGLRRPAYGGPLSNASGAVPDEVWLAVPVFERGEFMGSYLAAFSLSRALEVIVPWWFLQSHRVEVLDPGADLSLVQGNRKSANGQRRFLAGVDMPGSDTYLQVYSVEVPQATVPRAILGVALLFLVGMLGSLYFLRRDIDKRQRVEESLAAQVALRKSMEDSTDIGLIARDLSGVTLYVNRAFCGLVGYASADLLGANAPLPEWPNWTATSSLEHESVLEFRRSDGRMVQLQIHVVPLMHIDGRQIGWMNSVIDITERRRAERAAQIQRQRLDASGRLVAIGEVASTLAHELNQPLGALSSFANGLLNRLRQGNIEAAQVQAIVERINALSEKAGAIIRRVNAFVRRREMLEERLELAEFLSSRYATGGVTVRASLEVALHAQKVFVKADSVLLEQALHNVVQNAGEAASSSSQAARVRIELDLSDDRSHATISVSDNGPGVLEEAQSRMFDAFYSSKEDGMGMGLAICRSILEAHRGRIEVLRAGALGGACFRLWLPLEV